MERYEEYKDSGVEWIGEIPVGWEMKKIRQFTNILTGSTPKSTEGRYWNGDIFWVTTDDLGKLKTKYIIDTRRKLSEDGFEKSGTRLAPKGSIVLSTRAPIGHLGILKIEACSNQGCKTLVSNDKYNSEFVYYFLDAEKNFLNSLGTGTTFLELSTQSLKDNLVALPNDIQEQTAIANFLDRKTAEIDALIAQKERLLELYEEERTAVINHAVTKGIDPNAELKDSGVEWIGEIPVGWEVKQIKRISIVRRGASPRPIADPKYFDTNGEWAWVRIADVSASKKYLKRTTQTLSELGSSLSVKIEPGSIFLSIAGTVGKPIITKIKCCIHDGFVCFPNLKIDPEYLYYIFTTGLPYRGLGKWGTQLNLNTDTVGEIFIPIPRKEKMETIVHYLDRKTAEIDAQIAKTQRIIELQREYRTTLISDVVTGKIKVSHLAGKAE